MTNEPRGPLGDNKPEPEDTPARVLTPAAYHELGMNDVDTVRFGEQVVAHFGENANANYFVDAVFKLADLAGTSIERYARGCLKNFAGFLAEIEGKLKWSLPESVAELATKAEAAESAGGDLKTREFHLKNLCAQREIKYAAFFGFLHQNAKESGRDLSELIDSVLNLRTREGWLASFEAFNNRQAVAGAAADDGDADPEQTELKAWKVRLREVTRDDFPGLRQVAQELSMSVQPITLDGVRTLVETYWERQQALADKKNGGK
jgi:hypothetical protein